MCEHRLSYEEIQRLVDIVQEKYPYKITGNPETYSEHNIAWNESLEYLLVLVKHELSKGE